MTPTDVPPRAHGHAVRFAESQDQYETLPAWYTDDPEGAVITRWRLSWRERLGLLVGRPLWLYIWTFGRPLQPILPTLNEPTPDPAALLSEPPLDVERLADILLTLPHFQDRDPTPPTTHNEALRRADAMRAEAYVAAQALAARLEEPHAE